MDFHSYLILILILSTSEPLSNHYSDAEALDSRSESAIQALQDS